MDTMPPASLPSVGPPGPVVATARPAVCSRGSRILAGLMAGGAAAVLALASWLQPAGAGLGTHEQLRLPSCGWIMAMDLPCPTCGMTTAFAHAANGDMLASLGTQPLGFVLALATAMMLLLGVYVAATGSRIGSEMGRLWGRGSGWLIAGAVLAAWAYKIVAYRALL